MGSFIAIDIGSSFIKAALFNFEQNEIIDVIKIASPEKEYTKDPNKYEVKANAYVSITKEILHTFTTKYKDICGLLFSTQQHGFIYEYDSNPVYISWQDQRCIEKSENGKSFIEILSELTSRNDFLDCGVYLKPSLGLCNLYTLINTENIKKDGTLYTLGSYIIYKLCGKNVAHSQNLTQWGFFKPDSLSYSYDILKKVNLHNITLPNIALSDTKPIETITINNQIISIYPDFGDVQISALGAQVDDNGALINLGTAGQVVVPLETFKASTSFETRPYFNGKYIQLISNMPAGRNIDVLINFIHDVINDIATKGMSKNEIWERIHLILSNKNQSTLNIDPRFFATESKTDGGSINNIMSDNLNIKDLFNSLFKSMTSIYLTNISKLKELSSLSSIVCAGGTSWKVPELIQEIKHQSNLPCRLSAMQDESLNGMFLISKKCYELNKK